MVNHGVRVRKGGGLSPAALKGAVAEIELCGRMALWAVRGRLEEPHRLPSECPQTVIATHRNSYQHNRCVCNPTEPLCMQPLCQPLCMHPRRGYMSEAPPHDSKTFVLVTHLQELVAVVGASRKVDTAQTRERIHGPTSPPK